MRIKIKHIFALQLTLAAVFAAQAVAQAPVQPGASAKPYRAEVALGYSYVHSNAPPGGCGCFSLNGGNATFAWPVKPGSFALVGDVTIVDSGALSGSGANLILSTYTVGGRYLPKLGHSPLQPFGQALAGLAHAGGSVVSGSSSGNAGAAFAANIGGGVDLRASRRYSIRLAEADYLLTTFDNGSNNHQNNLRISAGIVIHF